MANMSYNLGRLKHFLKYEIDWEQAVLWVIAIAILVGICYIWSWKTLFEFVVLMALVVWSGGLGGIQMRSFVGVALLMVTAFKMLHETAASLFIALGSGEVATNRLFGWFATVSYLDLWLLAAAFMAVVVLVMTFFVRIFSSFRTKKS